MFKRRYFTYIALSGACLAYTACRIPAVTGKEADRNVPAAFSGASGASTAPVAWKGFFGDADLASLIDTALQRNQELNIVLQEIEISRNEVRARKGEYLPSVGLRAGAGVEKVGRYTSQGANDANTEIKEGKEMPEPLGDFLVGAFASWEVDIWHKLRNAKNSAAARYLATVEGRNFVVTNLIAEIAASYYELLALDRQLEIVDQNIAIQTNALDVVKLQKEATRVTELAVRKFEAEVLRTQSLRFDILQRITETENKINFLAGRYPQPIRRNDQAFGSAAAKVSAGIPADLLANRPDIRQAELNLAAAKLDVKSARAQFYPSLGITAGVGYRAFNPSYLVKTPESLLYSLAGDLVAPLVNRNAIKAAYYNANAKQIQSVYEYERTILNAYVEVVNQLSKIGNLDKRSALQVRQVDALTQSIDISNSLFASARADYMEVLLTQRDALESKFELIETQLQQMQALVGVYRALGGGWK
ncbi:TolC family protein [Chitinophaga sp.]|uniref:TolC family protein n=1 Tax=Chitinophaga sp. TaxID=1869181 RepID=UPI0026278B35|nr:TolC family protein [uncultured Chitinophaga sp.]